MSISRKQALTRGEIAIERPKAQMEVTLYNGKQGLTLRYQGKVITKTHATRVGRMIAPYVAEGLGVSLPKLAKSTKAIVSSGVLFRVLSISSLDLRSEEARMLLAYLLNEAQAMRGFKSAAID